MLMKKDLDMAFKNGLMVLYMRVSGRTIKLKGEVLFGMLKEMSM